jgi:hypothetical protein
LTVLIAISTLDTPIVRAQEAPDWQKAAGGKMEFDIASLKPSTGAFPNYGW